MATDPATILAIAQGIRLLIGAAGEASELLERLQSQSREPTENELRLLALRRRVADDTYDAFLRSKGIEPGTGNRIIH